MNVIFTKFHGPSNTRGARYVARFGDKSISVPKDYAFSPESQHWNAALKLIDKLGLPRNEWVRGDMLRNSEWVWVHYDRKAKPEYTFIDADCREHYSPS